MIYIVFAREETAFPHFYAWMDKWCGLIGAHPVAIDLIGGWDETHDGVPLVFHSYEDAKHFLVGAHPSIKLVWLDHRGEFQLGEFRHPSGDVAYFVGSDFTGFGDMQQCGVSVRAPMEGEFHAAMVLPMVIIDRLVRG